MGSTDKELKGQSERKFTLQEMIECWEGGREYGVDQIKGYHGAITFDRPDSKSYFKDKFNINLDAP